MYTILPDDLRIRAACVMQDGECIAATADIDTVYPQYSITKSLVSLVIGMLCSEGKLRLQQTVGELLGTPADAPLSRIPLEALLTMRSGIRDKLLFADRRDCPDYLAACLAQEITAPRFQYNNADAYLAGRMAEAAADEPLAEWIVRRIFRPLGIEHFRFESDPQGHFFAASGLQITTRDLAKLGQSVLDAGLYSRAWLQTATALHTCSDDGRGYGYLFWADGESCYMSGKWGQKCVILPAYRAVIAVNSEMPDNEHSLQYAMTLTSYLED